MLWIWISALMLPLGGQKEYLDYENRCIWKNIYLINYFYFINFFFLSLENRNFYNTEKLVGKKFQVSIELLENEKYVSEKLFQNQNSH